MSAGKEDQAELAKSQMGEFCELRESLYPEGRVCQSLTGEKCERISWRFC